MLMEKEHSPSRQMSVRHTVIWVAIAMGGLALLVVFELTAVTRWIHEATERMAKEAAGVRAAERLDFDLRAYNREGYLYARTNDPEHLNFQKILAHDLKSHLEETRSYVDNDDEAAVLKKIETKAHVFLAVLDATHQRNAQSSFDEYFDGAQDIDSIYRDIQSLVKINNEQANIALKESQRLEQLANDSAMGLFLVLLVSVGAIAYWVQRAVNRPFTMLRESMARYSAGENTVRAPEIGPAEFAQIAIQFNRMADTLAGQHKFRLQVLASVAHDLRNPLMALRMAMGILKKKDQRASRELMQFQLKLAKRQIDRMDRMIGDFMDVSLIESGHFKLQLETRDLCELARNTVDLFQPTTHAHRLELSVPGHALPIECDPLRMEQILNNLVSNAIKYSPNGGTVAVTCSACNGRAILSVRDEGMGISAEDRSRIFMPFTRVGAAKDSIPGIGLGLSVTRALVEAHGGSIELESTLGAGSTFQIQMPIKSSSVAPSEVQADVVAPSA